MHCYLLQNSAHGSKQAMSKCFLFIPETKLNVVDSNIAWKTLLFALYVAFIVLPDVYFIFCLFSFFIFDGVDN